MAVESRIKSVGLQFIVNSHAISAPSFRPTLAICCRPDRTLTQERFLPLLVQVLLRIQLESNH